VSEPLREPAPALDSEPEIAELPRADGAPRDGIAENDHAIPRWFNISFAATILFAFCYFPYYHVYGSWSAAQQYAAELEVAKGRAAAALANAPQTNPYRADAAALADGQQTFTTICAACHKPDASGLVGPSLVDPYWKYGASDADRFQSVAKGRPLGMPAWEAQLGPDRIWKVLAYVDSLPKSDALGVGAPANGAGK
jgi:cytochrome c oxidase cbb3-type subunit 3